MEIHNTTTHFSYKIEKKPDGGFIARSEDPGVETIEGATQEEVMRKIQAKAMAGAGMNLGGGFKLGGLQMNVTRKVNVTTSTKTGGVTAPLLEAVRQQWPKESPQAFASPIARSSDTTGTMLRVLAALIALGAIFYFLLHR
jgi:hypothetical protein